MTDKPQHSPTPWEITHVCEKSSWVRFDSRVRSGYMGAVYMGTKEQNVKNARHIVHCVNNHEALVAALEKSKVIIKKLMSYADIDAVDRKQYYNYIDETLDKAKGNICEGLIYDIKINGEPIDN